MTRFTLSTIEHVARELTKDWLVLDECHPIRYALRTDEVELRAHLPPRHGLITLDPRQLDDSPALVVDYMIERLKRANAAMLGGLFRDALDQRREIDWVYGDDPRDTEHERCERMALWLGDEAARLMRRAQALRPKAMG